MFALLHQGLTNGSADDSCLAGWCGRTSRDAVFWGVLTLTAVVLWGCNRGGEERRKEGASESSDTVYMRGQREAQISAYGLSNGDEEVRRESTYREAVAQVAPDDHLEGFQSSSEEGSDRREDLAEHIAALENADPSQRVQAVRNLWILTADMGVPEEALEALDYLVVQDSDLEVAKEAASAVADLRHLKEETDSVLFDSNSEAAPEERYQPDQLDHEIETSDMEGSDETGWHGLEAQNKEAIAQSQLENLEEQALWDPDAVKRGQAIQTLALYRSDATVDVLTQAAMDTDADNRYKAVEALWFSAADGLDKDSKIWLCLQQAQGDSDERVAELAAKALADLDHLEAARREAETALPSNDDHTLDLPIYNEDGRLISRD